MKVINVTVLTLVLFGFFTTSSAFCGVFQHGNQRAKEIKERLITLRNWQLMEELNLKGNRAQRVFDILKRFDDERETLIMKRRRLLRKLKDALETGSMSDAQLKRLMTEITETNVALARIPQRELRRLEQVFTPRELARYLLFSQRFARQARRLLARPRPGNRRLNEGP